MNCPVCTSEKLGQRDPFKPYSDQPWIFDLYDCETCGSRFADRSILPEAHEVLHRDGDSPYAYHYDVADRVKDKLAANDVAGAERFVRKLSYKYAAALDAVAAAAENHRALHILELGCSSGFMTALLRAKGHEAFGVDVSTTAVEEAGKRFGANFGTTPAGSSYDLIFHLGLIGCVNDPRTFLIEHLDLLADGGRMFFNAPNVESARTLGAEWLNTPPPDLVTLFNPDSFSRMIPANTYTVSTRLQSVPSEELHKRLALWMNKTVISYPRSFKGDAPALAKGRPGLGAVAHLCGRILKGAGLLKPFPVEYGIMVDIVRSSPDS